MEQLVSITQFAKLRNVTTETLRHYDRIGLLKPLCRKNGVRYYSILQYEKLGTIKELQQLGLSLKEIQGYFQNRNIEETHKLLVNKKTEIEDKIKELQKLCGTVNKRIEFINKLKETPISNQITEKWLPDRKFIYINSYIHDDTDLSYKAIELENIIPKDDFLPIFATNRYAGIIEQKDFDQAQPAAKIAIQVDEESQLNNTIRVPGHLYVCTYNIGTFFQRQEALNRIKKYMKDNGYEADGDVIQMSWVDYAITDYEMSYEFQVPVKKI